MKGCDIFSVLSLLMMLNPVAVLFIPFLDAGARSWDEAMGGVIYGLIVLGVTGLVAVVSILVSIFKLRWRRDKIDIFWASQLLISLIPMYLLVGYISKTLRWPRGWGTSVSETVLCFVGVLAWIAWVVSLRRSWRRAVDI